MDLEKFIDRDAEQELFDNLLKFEHDARLLTIRDKGGRGKSALLERLEYKCLWRSKPRRPVSRVKLDQLGDPDPFILIRTLVKDLRNWGLHFPLFDAKDDARIRRDFTPFAAPVNPIEGKINMQGANAGTGNIFAGVSNTVQIPNAQTVSVNVSPVAGWTSTDQEEKAREACIAAFFADLKNAAAASPVVVLLDSWEKCHSKLRDWLITQFVETQCFAAEARPAQFVVVLAGQEIPPFKDMLGEAEHTRLVHSVEALGAWEEKHVKAFLELHGYKNFSDIEVTLLCEKLKTGWSLDQALETYKQFKSNDGG